MSRSPVESSSDQLSPQDSRGLRVVGQLEPGFDSILSRDALEFLAGIVDQFNDRLQSLLRQRDLVEERIHNGALPSFLKETEEIRRGSWKIGSIPEDLKVRRVEITGPVDRKMMINALNSGADVYMADFEDSHSPAWKGTVQGQLNLRDAVNGRLDFVSPEGKKYRLNEKTATLCVRPRGLHLVEKHVLDSETGRPVPASFFDFALYLYHNSGKLREKGTGPYFYLPKLESHHEARLWNDVFDSAERTLGLPHGTIKCTVLIENILAAFEMDEILFELRDHITGLNFGRWDYIFSFIKKLGWSFEYLFPERSQLTMTVPFLRSCAVLLVQTCQKRGAYPMGGMAANVPLRNNPTVQKDAIDRVIIDKEREASQGYAGAWVAHPDLVPVVLRVFSEKSPGRIENQESNRSVRVTAEDLLAVPTGTISEQGVRTNVSVSLQYLSGWLNGLGSVAINGLMEDTATVEISRAQLWQWVRFKIRLVHGTIVTPEYFRKIMREELEKANLELGSMDYLHGRFEEAAEILDRVVTRQAFVGFIPLVGYDYLD